MLSTAWPDAGFSPDDQTPLRASLFSILQMEQYGKSLAAEHVLALTKKTGDQLLTRLDQNETILLHSCDQLSAAVKGKERISPAGEWLLDNVYLIAEQIRTARQHFPRNYSRELPSLAAGKSAGLPRVYDLVLAPISHGDGRIDEEIIQRFLAAYQSVTSLKLGELWAVPIMLRLALLENLRRVAIRVMLARNNANLARNWANRMIDTAASDPKSLIMVIADMARSNPPLVSAFIAELARRLQGHGSALALPLTWIEQRLGEVNLTIEQLVQSENQQQAADQVSVSNSIGSLRFLSEMDWRAFVESQSVTERVLRDDPARIYHTMDFSSRDQYRHVVERLARQSNLSEETIARAAISITQQNSLLPESTPYESHVGYYLTDKGLPQLEDRIRLRSGVLQPLIRSIAQHPFAVYLSVILLLIGLVSWGLLTQLDISALSVSGVLLAGTAVFLGAGQFVSVLVNWLATLLITPQRLPRLDFTKGLPLTGCSVVVVPAMLSHSAQVEKLLENLEVRFLGNQDPQLYFALLTDFTDAPQPILPTDTALLQQAQHGIELLNEKYSAAGLSQFFLFHRPRLWNPAEQAWMGFERKRGKLAALNSLLRENDQQAFSLLIGNLPALTLVKYVITLDTDTQLPRDAARQMIAVMSHPLNQPRFDEAQQRVVGGYGILQPRIVSSLITSDSSRYASYCTNESGIDPYTRAVSDVYQDVFAEGSFIGKGIYDLDAFERSLKNKMPLNQILSHDLLEGSYARSGLLSDVQLFEESPERYSTDVGRRERWIRGDWQIARWLFPKVPAENGQLISNSLSVLSRWKILDNLLRSLIPLALLTLLLLGWLIAPQVISWTLLTLSLLFLPALLIGMLDLLRKPEKVLFRQHFATALRNTWHSLRLIIFRLACLPHEAVYSLAAVLISNWRVIVSKRYCLAWRISDAPQADNTIAAVYRLMWTAPVIAIATFLALLLLRSNALIVAAPFLLLWLFAPLWVWWLSEPRQPEIIELTDRQKQFLRRIARKTWRFFDHFNSAEDNWLLPDNFQEQPRPVIAHRTSPTNIGLSLLANLSAYDFGYISAANLLERTQRICFSLGKLTRYRGHFFNWYDTRSLQPLAPRYISSVDSGNLAGHLITLQSGIKQLPEYPVVNPQFFAGLGDTLALLTESLLPAEQAELLPLQQLLSQQKPETLPQMYHYLSALQQSAQMISQTFAYKPDTEAVVWSVAVLQQCQQALSELLFIFPWLVQAESTEADILLTEPDVLIKLKTLPAVLTAMQTETSALIQTSSLVQADWLQQRYRLLSLSQLRLAERDRDCQRLISALNHFSIMEYDFLYDPIRHLLAVGYNLDDNRRDKGCYDLLASEARLGNFVAIAQGQIPQESWFALGRLRTSLGGSPILVSWSGSMFEYLMPLLVMPSFEGTLLHQTCNEAVARQIAYGKLRGVPWGVSESGYNKVDASANYQYLAFGIPGLGFKRGLAEDLVIAPYASVLALLVAPQEACANLQRLADDGFEGRFGLYEAIDYTPTRLARGQKSAVVYSFMAHHQGMSFLALAHVLIGPLMQQRFAAEPVCQATLLLLQERIPKNAVFHTLVARHAQSKVPFSGAANLNTPLNADTATPQVQLLSNGQYHVMLTNAGGGYSRWKDLAVTRWREDSTCDNWGSFIYLRDLDDGQFWSATLQPTLAKPDSFEAMFSEGRAEFRRRDHHIESYTEIVVSPEDNIELRRLRLTNHSRLRRTIEVTSYTEVVLATSAADAMQPAFSNLFVQTEIVADCRAILCTRRPRSAAEATPWLFHLLTVNGKVAQDVSYETDRMRFIGRGRDLIAPDALVTQSALSGTAGSVLDPVASIRCRITLEPGQSAVVDLVTGTADNRENIMLLVDKYQDKHLTDRVFDLSCIHNGITLRQINASESDAQCYRLLAGAVLYANAVQRADADVLLQNRRGQSGLWGYAISGDLPIVLLKISDVANIELARQLIQCHAYLRLKGLVIDLVIWNEDHLGYRQRLQERIIELIATGSEAHNIDRPGGIFIHSGEQISHEDRVLLKAVARVIIDDRYGDLYSQLNRRSLTERRLGLLPVFRENTNRYSSEDTVPDVPPAFTTAGNQQGEFNAQGTEYRITSYPGKRTPLPWVNVLANPHFGTVVSESSLGYSWSENAHEFRLTPWHNDAVANADGEAIYLRDEESGHFWSPTPFPCGGKSAYLTRHGFGYSVFEHTEEGIQTELWVYVDLTEAVKLSVLKIRNHSGRPRKLSATAYVEWVLGDLRLKTAMHIATEQDSSNGALFARNAYNTEFSGRVAFLDVNDNGSVLTGDRCAFIGRNGSLSRPLAMKLARLSGRLGVALDPCGAVQSRFELSAGASKEIIFRLGSAKDTEQARSLIQKFRQPDAAADALRKVQQYWQHTLGAVQVETPDPALNQLANGWLVYQTLACRLWARSGFYQSGGAFGFRDQLQDAMALIHTKPQLLREQLLLCASRQYPEGDVQHWWHPPMGRGVRTRCSDDYLWLPLATCRYLDITEDHSILAANIPFLDGRPLNPDEESYYDQPSQNSRTATLYQHCVLAIEHGLRFGKHGLPLMGSGDWNDGMNLVGIEGKGESVWLGFFLYNVLTLFSDVAREQGDDAFAGRCCEQAEKLYLHLNLHGWDGDWFRRAYFDDGTPLGSSVNAECAIDSIAQSWSVLSGATTTMRMSEAMNSLDKHLVQRRHGLVQLLKPPFDTSPQDPGYIKGYVPGVRENGGQYTHAAIWAAMAFAKLGDSQRAWELLALINPLNHSKTAADIAVYKAEPYVVAADVYGVEPHIGRGGWSWYTGSAGWLYRLILESLLGIRRQGSYLYLKPCLPKDWQRYSISYRFGETFYQIEISQQKGDVSTEKLTLDGIVQQNSIILLQDDKQSHKVSFEIT